MWPGEGVAAEGPGQSRVWSQGQWLDMDSQTAGGHAPVYDELVIGRRFVTHGAHPGGLLLIHLQVEDGVEALQVGTGLCPAGH